MAVTSPPTRVTRLEDLANLLDPAEPVVTLFSGGLDGAYLLLLLAQLGFRDVTALVVDLGGEADHERTTHLGNRLGAKVEHVDRREVFVEEFVLPAVRAHAVYLGLHPLSSSLSRPLIAREAIDCAHRAGASAILHSANRSQNTLRRLNGALGLLGCPAGYGSPYELSAITRQEKQYALAEAGIGGFADRALSSDTNLWCREFESGPLDDPEDFTPPPGLYVWSNRSPHAEPVEVSITFERGKPVALDGERLDGTEIIGRLNVLAGSHGLGRYSGLEHLDTGEKVLEVREMPAAELLLKACRTVESATVDAETMREKLAIEQLWVREALEGRWYGVLRRAAEEFVAQVAQEVSGTVRLALSGHGAELRSVRAERNLYVRDRESWERHRSARPDAGSRIHVVA
jgi:argininosuccinate synthase